MKTDYEKARRRYQDWRARGEGRSYLAVLFSMCEGICPQCDKNMWLGYGEVHGLPLLARATFDHIDPLKFTKRHDKTNLRICCQECNQSLGHTTNTMEWNSTVRAVGFKPDPNYLGKVV